MNIEEKLCLQWNDFKENLGSSFGELRGDKDLTDVTLACEDGEQVEAHKIVLATSSPFFMNLLKRNKHPHPLIYMKGLKSEELLAILDFLYFGEISVLQEKLESFLALAEELQLKGLTGSANSAGEAEEPKQEGDSRNRSHPVKKEKSQEQRQASNPGHQILTDPKTEVVVTNNQIGTNLEDLNEKIKTMMTTNARSADGRYIATCNICGKEATAGNLPNHIEANHISGVSYPCHICGKVSKSRNALRMHKNRDH